MLTLTLTTVMASAHAAMVVATLLAQAEPAPPEPPPPPAPTGPAATPEPPFAPPNAMAVHGRYAYRPDDSSGAAPTGGFSMGATFERRYAVIAGRVGLGAGLDLFYDHFSSEGEVISVKSKLLTQTSFVALQTLSVELRPVRPWIAAGAGVTIAYYSGSNVTNQGGVTDTEAQPLVRAAAGVDVDVARRSALVLRADYTHPLTHPTFGGFAASPLGDLIDVGVGFLYRF
jgi:hypothetical protein